MLFFIKGYSQKTIYSFKDTISVKKAPIEITKEIIKPNILLYTGLFNYNKFKKIKFKKNDEKWYVKIDKKWYLFFNNGEKVNLIFNFGKFKYSILWSKSQLTSQNRQDVFECRLQPIGVTMSAITIYYFTIEEGFIAIKSHDGFFVRNDIKIR